MMIFEQFYLESLGHASYLVGDERTGRALVLDPRRDVDVYLESARMHGVRIAYAIDTHGHNDYLSGLSEVRLRQDMEVLGYASADLGYDHRSVTDGEVIEMGDLAFEVIHTPGHTPEHVSLLVYDHARGEDPVLLLAGGALLVGDVGRPDLLGSPHDVAAAARVSCRTIRHLLHRLGETWAGTVLPEGTRVLLVLDGPAQLWEAAWQLLRMGYDLPEGWLSGGM